MPFSFKQFHIHDSHCGMPVSTDGVILGAWAPLTEAKHILDIGAGSGLLSLMAAQRSRAQITAIEVDSHATLDCQHNIHHSPWAERITLIQGCVTLWAQTSDQKYDHILCNPPYFNNGPQSKDQRRATARHTDTLNFDMLLNTIKSRLSPDGRASLILPQASLKRFLSLLSQYELTLLARVDIASVASKTPQRHLLLLTHQTSLLHPVHVTQLTIKNHSGAYSQEMIELTRDFYLKM